MDLFSDILDVLSTTLNESVKSKKLKETEEPDKSYIKKMNLVRLKITYKESAKSLLEYLTNDIELDQDEFKSIMKTYKYMLKNPRTDDDLKQNILKSLAILYYIYFNEDGLWIEKLNKCVTIILSERNENKGYDKLHSSIKDDTVLGLITELAKSKTKMMGSVQNIGNILHL